MGAQAEFRLKFDDEDIRDQYNGTLDTGDDPLQGPERPTVGVQESGSNLPLPERIPTDAGPPMWTPAPAQQGLAIPPMPYQPPAPGVFGQTQQGGGPLRMSPGVVPPTGTMLSPEVDQALRGREDQLRAEAGRRGPISNALMALFGEKVTPEAQLAGLAVQRQKLEDEAQQKRLQTMKHIAELTGAFDNMPEERQREFGSMFQQHVSKLMAGAGYQVPTNLFSTEAEPKTVAGAFSVLSDPNVAPGEKAAIQEQLRMARKDPVKQDKIIEDFTKRKGEQVADQLRFNYPDVVADVKRELHLGPKDEIDVATLDKAIVGKYPGLNGVIGSRALDALAKNQGPGLGVITGDIAKKRLEQKPPVDDPWKDFHVTQTEAGYVQADPEFVGLAASMPGVKPGDVIRRMDPIARGALFDRAAKAARADVANANVDAALRIEAGKVTQQNARPFDEPSTTGGRTAYDEGVRYRNRNTGLYADMHRSTDSLAADKSLIRVSKAGEAALAEMPMTEQYIGAWRDVATKLPPETTGTAGRFKFLAKEYIGKAQGLQNTLGDTDALNGRLGQMARSLGGERGVLTEGDVKRASNMFGSIWDSREKMTRRLDFVANAVALHKRALLGTISESEAKSLTNKMLNLIEAAETYERGRLGNASGRGGGRD